MMYRRTIDSSIEPYAWTESDLQGGWYQFQIYQQTEAAMAQDPDNDDGYPHQIVIAKPVVSQYSDELDTTRSTLRMELTINLDFTDDEDGNLIDNETIETEIRAVNYNSNNGIPRGTSYEPVNQQQIKYTEGPVIEEIFSNEMDDTYADGTVYVRGGPNDGASESDVLDCHSYVNDLMHFLSYLPNSI